MSTRVILTLCILFASSLAVQALQDSANEKDKKALQGKWDVISVVIEGKKEKGDKKVTATFEGGTLKFDPKSRDFSEFSFTLDATKTPKALDLKSKGDSNVGIYELKGDDLKICLTQLEPVDKNRPKEFAGSKDTILFVLKRVKK
jgi:uncharacterized protein (TIGR03067 family)